MRQILIISNNDSTISSIVTLLKAAGYSHIDVARDSRTAYSKIYSLCPHLIILDCEMEENETLLVKRILAGPLANITILIVPHTNVDAYVLEGVKNGYFHFLTRPVGKDPLIFSIREILE